MNNNTLPTETSVEQWKQEQIKKHRASNHSYVVFTHRTKEESGKCTYSINAGGYQGYPDWRERDNNVEIVNVETGDVEFSTLGQQALPEAWPESYMASPDIDCNHFMQWDSGVYRCIHECGLVHEEPPESKLETQHNND